MPRDPAPPLLQRAALLPFVPRLWSAAAGWTTGQVVLALLLVILLVDGGLALYRGIGMRAELATWAGKYEAGGYAPIVLEKGEVRVEGGKVVHIVDDDNTLLVDPEEQIPLAAVTTPEYMVVRRTEMIRKRHGRTETTEISQVQQFLPDPLRIDGPSLRAFTARWGLAVVLGTAAFLLAFMLVGEAIAASVYATVAAGIALGLRGKGLGLDFGSCLRVALAALSATVVAELLLNLAGRSPGFCFGAVLWPVVLAILTTWRVGR